MRMMHMIGLDDDSDSWDDDDNDFGDNDDNDWKDDDNDNDSWDKD